MNTTRLKCFFVLLILCVIGFGPLSITGLIGLYTVARRPRWFAELVEEVYRGIDPPASAVPQRPSNPGAAVGARLRCSFALAGLMIIDVAPVPVIGSIGLYTVLRRPLWFRKLVHRVYGLT